MTHWATSSSGLTVRAVMTVDGRVGLIGSPMQTSEALP
jgi:hypothetical protein